MSLCPNPCHSLCRLFLRAPSRTADEDCDKDWDEEGAAGVWLINDKIGLHRLYIKRQRAQLLYGIDTEQDVTLATKMPDTRQVHTKTVVVLYRAD